MKASEKRRLAEKIAVAIMGKKQVYNDPLAFVALVDLLIAFKDAK